MSNKRVQLVDPLTEEFVSLKEVEMHVNAFLGYNLAEMALSVSDFKDVRSFIFSRPLHFQPFILRAGKDKCFVKLKHVEDEDLKLWYIISFKRLNNLEFMECINDTRSYLEAKLKRSI